MKIEKLANNKVIVTLTSDELDGLDINVHNLNDDKKMLNDFLIHIMEAVREETGFNPYSGQIVVEAKCFRDELIITVSKMKETLASGARKARRVSVKPKTAEPVTDVFYFKDFDDVCGAIARLDECLYDELQFYKVDGSYCLLFACDGINEGNKEAYFKNVFLLKEYCERTSPNELQYCHIREHGTYIAHGDKLKSMAHGIRELYKI